MIEVKKLTKRYDGVEVLSGLNLHVRKGTIYGLVGPNGAGKTTVINHINGAMKPECGSVTVMGEDVYDNEKVKQKILNISDDWFYFGTYTVKQMAAFYEDAYRTFSVERYEKLRTMFGIDEKKQIRKMSKGQKKQVAFWLSLSAMPEVLVLDEPLDGLDPVMRKQVLSLIIADVADRGLTVLVSSHNLRELEDICDWVGIIHNGSMIAEKPLDDIKGSVCKYQVAFGEDKEEFVNSIEGLLAVQKTGSVYSLIIRGDSGAVENLLRSESPLIVDRISLTLEEVFIYELGGMGYDLKNIIF